MMEASAGAGPIVEGTVVLPSGVPPPEAVRKAAQAFERGIGVSSRFRDSVMQRWRRRLQDELDTAGSEADGLERIESLKIEFFQTEVEPRRYWSLLAVWIGTMVLGGLVVAALFDERSVCQGIHGGFCDEFYGHFVGYIAFRYAMYGVLIGCALRISAVESQIGFGQPRAMLTRPAVGLILGSVLAYLLARLVAEGRFSLNVFGMAIERGMNPPNSPFFTDSGALFLLGLMSGIASDVLLQSVVGAAMEAGEEIFKHRQAAG